MSRCIKTVISFPYVLTNFHRIWKRTNESVQVNEVRVCCAASTFWWDDVFRRTFVVFWVQGGVATTGSNHWNMEFIEIIFQISKRAHYVIIKRIILLILLREISAVIVGVSWNACSHCVDRMQGLWMLMRFKCAGLYLSLCCRSYWTVTEISLWCLLPNSKLWANFSRSVVPAIKRRDSNAVFFALRSICI